MSSILFLIFAILSLAATFVALVRVHQPAFISFPVMMTGWLTSEWPFFHFFWQAIVAAVFIWQGALDDTAGVIAMFVLLASWVGLLLTRQVGRAARPTSEAALRAGFGDDYLDRIPESRRAQLRTTTDAKLARHPMRNDKTGIVFHSDIAYGDHPKRNLLDVYQPESAQGAPVLMHVHGGGWMIGNKVQQGQPLLHQLARHGYVGVSINYRLAPKYRFPDPIIDVKRAIAWVRDNIADYGGDPNTIILTGGSAGGHLTSLAALTPGEPRFQPGFESADTSVAGCAPFYGPPDFRDRHGIRGRMASMEGFLGRMIMPGPVESDPELWDLVSPIAQVNADAPPFFIIQGFNDVLVWREEQHAFVEALRAVSRNPVGYWEVPGAQHAFDTFNSRRSEVAVDTVERFVAWVAAQQPALKPEA